MIQYFESLEGSEKASYIAKMQADRFGTESQSILLEERENFLNEYDHLAYARVQSYF